MGESTEGTRSHDVGHWRSLALAVAGAVALLLSVLVGVTPASAGSASLPAGPGTITVDQGPVGPTGFCLPSLFALSYSTHQDATTYTLKVYASASLCDPVHASAVIYAMPTDGSQWPQQLAVKQAVVIPGPGVTTITFHKGCLPAQYDVLTGDTPATISPLGPWHGPLLFPFSIDTSLQFFGGNCGGTGGNCDDYTPTNMAVEPSSIAPGGTVTVSGGGTPGTKIDILLRQPPASPVPTGASVTVGADGHWSVPVTVPSDIAPGTWQVVARVDGCETQTTADLTVTGDQGEGEPGPGTPAAPGGEDQGGTPPAEALAASASQPLPAAAVESANATSSAPSSSNAEAAGLAFTGSTVRLPVLVGLVLLVAGALLLIKRRRSRS